MNYGPEINAAQGDGTTKAIPPALGADSTLVAESNHAGAVFTTNGNAKVSAVWDTVSTAAPNYIAAALTVPGCIHEPSKPASIGSPGQ
jgi:hypothetical protein